MIITSSYLKGFGDLALVLGAGASVPYDYPVGKDLIKEIITDLEDDVFIPQYNTSSGPPFWNENDKKHDVLYSFSECEKIISDIAPYIDYLEESRYMLLNDNGSYQINLPPDINANVQTSFFKTQINRIDIFAKLQEALEVFDPISIDAFLRDNPSYARAGKMMILYSLLKREDPLKFNINQSNDNWYSLLLNDLVSECADSPNKLSENKVKFITFNYDVSLDYFLHSRLKKIENFVKNDDKSESPADSFLNELDIEHVYGQLYLLVNPDHYGKYMDFEEGKKVFNTSASWGNGEPHHSANHTSLKLIQNFKRFVFSFKQYDNIKTMYDERNNPTERDQIIAKHKEAIEWAEEIIFIGFGFDRDNLNLLGFPDTLSEYNKIFPGKTIRYLNYEGIMKSLPLEFESIEKKRFESLNSKTRKEKDKIINIIQSTAGNISSAYQNDFKKFLLK